MQVTEDKIEEPQKKFLLNEEAKTKHLSFTIDLQILTVTILLLIHTVAQFIAIHSDYFNPNFVKSFNVAFLTIMLWFFEKNYNIIFDFIKIHVADKTFLNQVIVVFLTVIITGVVLLLVTLVFEEDSIYNYLFFLADWLTVFVLIMLCKFSETDDKILINTNRVVNSYGIFEQICYIILRSYQYNNDGEYGARLVADGFTLVTRLFLFIIVINQNLLEISLKKNKTIILFLIIVCHVYNFAVDLAYIVIDRENLPELLDAGIEFTIYLIYGYMFYYVFKNKQSK